MKLSITIPTLNEEKYLPLLLESIKKQDFADYEIIVADANSKDRTREIARRYKCKVVKGGLPAVARNNGAKIAKGELLLFLDADVVLEQNFLKDNINEFYRKGLGAATCRYVPLSTKAIDYVFAESANLWIAFTQYFNPHAAGFCIFAKKDLHEKISGYDTSLTNSEDHNYVKRAGKLSKFRVLKSKPINFSMRRFEWVGRFKLACKYLHFLFYRLLKGEITSEKHTYNLDK